MEKALETIAILRLQDSMGNKKTLKCFQDADGYINYRLWGGWDSSGTPHALSNLQCDRLPYDREDLGIKIHKDSKIQKKEFVSGIRSAVNNYSICRVIKETKPVDFL